MRQNSRPFPSVFVSNCHILVGKRKKEFVTGTGTVTGTNRRSTVDGSHTNTRTRRKSQRIGHFYFLRGNFTTYKSKSIRMDDNINY
jgi:hypothetical protein